MSDFFQNGVIASFHKLGKPDLRRLERELRKFSQIRPIALILPSLFREFSRGTLPNIMSQVKKATYLHQIVLSLDKATLAQFKKVKAYFRDILHTLGKIGDIKKINWSHKYRFEQYRIDIFSGPVHDSRLICTFIGFCSLEHFEPYMNAVLDATSDLYHNKRSV